MALRRRAGQLARFGNRLNEIGADGWEMIGYESVPLYGAFSKNLNGYAYLALFKKPYD